MWGSSIMDQRWMRKLAVGALALGTVALAGGAAWSSTGVMKPAAQEWNHNGITGTYDKAAAQRGLQVYKEVCAACHSLSLVAYRTLADLGYSEEQVKAMAAEVEVQDGPNDDGEMFARPGRPYDHFKAPFANEKAARAANGGAYPPDMSLIVKAREDGENYIYALLDGYADAPAGHEVPEGKYYNPYYPGGNIAMPAPLSDGAVTYQDGTEATRAQMAHDVVTFLSWTAEPKLDERHRMGIVVVSFLIIFTGILFAVYRRVWKDVH